MRAHRAWGLGLLTALLAACGGGSAEDASDTILLYTCVNEETVQPVIDQFQAENPGSTVELFRAPTGDLNARVASDVRGEGLQADVIWACDPLTMQDYVDQGLVGGWTPQGASEVPAQFRTEDYVGVAVLYMVAVHHEDTQAPTSWRDMTGPGYDAVAVPDPTVAASALGALGYFSQEPGYGLEFYADIAEAGGEQVGTPDEVTTAVAQGVYDAGITIANSAYLARDAGSPIEVVWPAPGAIAIYGPIAASTDSDNTELAQDFISYVASEPGQQVVGQAGSYPTFPDVDGPEIPADAPVVVPDWATITAAQDQLLSDYAQIFGA